MKTILILLILSSALAMPAIGALDDADLDKIRVIINEAHTPIKTDVAWLRGKMDNLDKQISWLMVLIVVAVGLPQAIIAWRGRKDRALEKQIETLTQEIETLKQQRIVNP